MYYLSWPDTMDKEAFIDIFPFIYGAESRSNIWARPLFHHRSNVPIPFSHSTHQPPAHLTHLCSLYPRVLDILIAPETTRPTFLFCRPLAIPSVNRKRRTQLDSIFPLSPRQTIPTIRHFATLPRSRYQLLRWHTYRSATHAFPARKWQCTGPK